LTGPYGGIGATGFGSTGYGCGQGAYAFANYGYGQALGLGPQMPTCGGFGNYPYLYPYYVGYPYATGTTPLGALSLSGLLNNNPLFGTTGCDVIFQGSNFLGQPTTPIGGAAGQFALGNNQNILNLTNPALSTLSNFGTLGSGGLTGCSPFR
jgi:hypothetical protein